MSRLYQDNKAMILNAIDLPAGSHILEIGCGHGAILNMLSKAGFYVSGIDPSADAIAAVSQKIPEGTFKQATGESLPFEDNSFDAVIFGNSLHHIPQNFMSASIDEAIRVSSKRVVIMEPICEGPYDTIIKPIDDETIIRDQAIAAINSHIINKHSTRSTVEYTVTEKVKDYDDMKDSLIKVDETRAHLFDVHDKLVRDLFRQYAVKADDGYSIDQPMRIDRFDL